MTFEEEVVLTTPNPRRASARLAGRAAPRVTSPPPSRRRSATAARDMPSASSRAPVRLLAAVSMRVVASAHVVSKNALHVRPHPTALACHHLLAA